MGANIITIFSLPLPYLKYLVIIYYLDEHLVRFPRQLNETEHIGFNRTLLILIPGIRVAVLTFTCLQQTLLQNTASMFMISQPVFTCQSPTLRLKGAQCSLNCINYYSIFIIASFLILVFSKILRLLEVWRQTKRALDKN